MVLDIEGKGIIEAINHFDVFISDYDEERVSNIVADYLKVSYLSKATWPPTFPVFGCILGFTKRSFINLAVRYKECEPINVIFLIDTASPVTFLTDATINSILQGKGTFEDDTCVVNIHGRLQSVKRSNTPSHHFNEVNLLGTDYLMSTSLVLTADYVNKQVKLEKGVKVNEI